MSILKTEEGETIRSALVGDVTLVHVSYNDGRASSFALNPAEMASFKENLQKHQTELTGSK